MWMGTKLFHLQKHRRRLGWQMSKANPADQQKHSITRYTTEEHSEPSVHSKISDTTNPPAHPDTIL